MLAFEAFQLSAEPYRIYLSGMSEMLFDLNTSFASGGASENCPLDLASLLKTSGELFRLR